MCVPRAPKDFRNYIELHMAIALSRGEDTTLAKFVPRVDSERWLVAAWCAGIGKPKVVARIHIAPLSVGRVTARKRSLL